MIEPIYKCPNCQQDAFVVNGSLPGKYLVGFCLDCGESATLPESAIPLSAQVFIGDIPPWQSGV